VAWPLAGRRRSWRSRQVDEFLSSVLVVIIPAQFEFEELTTDDCCRDPSQLGIFLFLGFEMRCCLYVTW
jgi:hypothetical protein